MSAAGPPPQLLRVRAAALTDLEAIGALEARCFDDPWSAGSVADFWASPGARAWLAEVDGQAVAHALFRVVAGEAELLRVATAPAWRRRQVAGTLLGAAFAELDGAGVDCHLEVRADNRAALALYGALGFEPSGRRKKYYADDCDACLLTRKGRPVNPG